MHHNGNVRQIPHLLLLSVFYTQHSNMTHLYWLILSKTPTKWTLYLFFVAEITESRTIRYQTIPKIIKCIMHRSYSGLIGIHLTHRWLLGWLIQLKYVHTKVWTRGGQEEDQPKTSTLSKYANNVKHINVCVCVCHLFKWKWPILLLTKCVGKYFTYA